MPAKRSGDLYFLNPGFTVSGTKPFDCLKKMLELHMNVLYSSA